ncbi:MAG: hypothetical protein COV76_00105 [Candidatus Omnitrophica bacterium CG11_big_fil_rev_8_21_14_0_20_64_10]|nr:MAG: hypothetical protein COV76_00105 [Candidatus Omnitrophica bacterium CG11_big_fil_rev_8_21_14_0_20_64_10]
MTLVLLLLVAAGPASAELQWDWAYWNSIGVPPPLQKTLSAVPVRRVPSFPSGHFEWDEAYWMSIGVEPPGGFLPARSAVSETPVMPPAAAVPEGEPSEAGWSWDADYWTKEGMVPPSAEGAGQKEDSALREIVQSLTLSSGYRQDDLRWNIAGDVFGQNPNIISELTWSDLDIAWIRVDGDHEIEDLLTARFYFDYGWVTDGRNRDSDYNTDNRQDEFSRSDNRSDRGTVMDASVGIGYPFSFWKARFRVAPMLGYSYHEQDLRITDGFQSIPATGSFGGLNSAYEAVWYGPWSGLDVGWQLTDKLSLMAQAEYHWEASYRGTADWNLRTDFKHPESFIHRTDGQGIIASLGFLYHFKENWSLDAFFDVQEWRGNSGLIRFYLASNSSQDQRLNEVISDSYGGRIGLTYRF